MINSNRAEKLKRVLEIPKELWLNCEQKYREYCESILKQKISERIIVVGYAAGRL